MAKGSVRKKGKKGIRENYDKNSGSESFLNTKKKVG